METIEFLAIGHVTRDLLPAGGWVAGGTVTYAARTAQRLGLASAVLTSAPPDFDVAAVLPGVAVHVVPSVAATTFENVYEGGFRRQIVHHVASPLHLVDLPAAWSNPRVALLGPLVGELQDDWFRFCRSCLLGVTPQGWMRQWDREGRVSPREWSEAGRILPQVDVLVFSEDDVARDEALIERYARAVRTMAVTRGEHGATVYHRGDAQDFPAFPVRAVDPTGAGDVFAASFLVRLAETDDVRAAARFANCAASFVVEGVGVDRIPTREQVQERLRLAGWEQG